MVLSREEAGLLSLVVMTLYMVRIPSIDRKVCEHRSGHVSTSGHSDHNWDNDWAGWAPMMLGSRHNIPCVSMLYMAVADHNPLIISGLCISLSQLTHWLMLVDTKLIGPHLSFLLLSTLSFWNQSPQLLRLWIHWLPLTCSSSNIPPCQGLLIW